MTQRLALCARADLAIRRQVFFELKLWGLVTASSVPNCSFAAVRGCFFFRHLRYANCILDVASGRHPDVEEVCLVVGANGRGAVLMGRIANSN